MIKQYRTGVKIMPNILIVEDDININNLLCEVLRKAGYTCEQAFSGTEAKLLLDIKEKAYTLLLLDLMLPGASGEEVLKEIRKQGRLPVIVLTAKDSIDDKIGVLTDGADDYITKPFEIREVLARIQVSSYTYKVGLNLGVNIIYPLIVMVIIFVLVNVAVRFKKKEFLGT